jgi:hypothetical protein
MLKVDPVTKKFYILWPGFSNVKIYGDNIPKKVMDDFASSMNSKWGHVQKYVVHGQTIVIEEKEK